MIRNLYLDYDHRRLQDIEISEESRVWLENDNSQSENNMQTTHSYAVATSYPCGLLSLALDVHRNGFEPHNEFQNYMSLYLTITVIARV